uniref:Uncharacterized protein n=1 Tax=Alexandrium monilatum TaxID=311494 RepID=A0A7S4T1N7_9DINO
MVSLRSGALAVLAAVALAWTTGSLLFVQPAPGARAGPNAGAEALRQAGLPSSPLDVLEPAAVEGSSLRGLVLGLALGLVVGLAGVSFPGAARAEGVKAPDDYDIRKGQSEEERKAWNAAKAKIWNVRQFSSPPDKKYSIPTTGAGRYKQFGIDFASPIPTIPNTNDGTYPLPARPAEPEFEFEKKFKKMIAEGKLKAGKYGNYYSPSSPYPYNPK